jgi:hypothetical protein
MLDSGQMLRKGAPPDALRQGRTDYTYVDDNFDR